MNKPVPMIEVLRGQIVECSHLGHAVVSDAAGNFIHEWGDGGFVTYPRSSCKMIQALPLVESGAADAFGLGTEQLALACASHKGAAIHTERVTRWLAHIGAGEADLRCGTQWPDDLAARNALIKSDRAPCQIHNNCSGKHTGFLTYCRHTGAGPEYAEPDHALQRDVRAAFEEVTGEISPGFGVDGCSAPNFATSIGGLARAMAFFAAASANGDARQKAAVRLRDAMILHPELVSGEDGGSTALMRAARGKAAVKSGADGVFVAILPERGLGVALKIVDGGQEAKETAMAAILLHLGVVDAADPAISARVNATRRNRRGLPTGVIRPAAGFTV